MFETLSRIVLLFTLSENQLLSRSQNWTLLIAILTKDRVCTVVKGIILIKTTISITHNESVVFGKIGLLFINMVKVHAQLLNFNILR